MQIVRMKTSHYKKVYSLWINTPGMGLNTLDDSKKGISKYLRRNPKTCFIAKADSKVVGVILSGHDGRRGFIYHAAVDCAYRKQGIGSALVNAALDALKKEGIHKVALVVFAANELGDAFWEKRGFSRRDDLAYRDTVISNLGFRRIDT